ncbi:MAG: pitrilysin family protein [Candidatus Faecivicinus sp.]|nr:pitrilysin family protein [Candidatus Faecivicinus sp.]
MNFDQITLKNGLRIIGERIPHFRSVSVGFWVGSGSQYETPDEAGLSHFLEHMVFKGTEKRTTRQIAEEMDRVGGQLNAFTSKECTCFYAKVVDEHLPLAMDVLSDLVTAPIFDPAELEKEKGVVIEEISMSADDPEDSVHELLMLANYGDQPIARPILGTEEKIAAYSSDDLRAYWKKMYRPQNTVLALAGNYDWERVIALAEKLLGAWSPDAFEARSVKTNPVPVTLLNREKDIEQIHICLGFPALKIGDERSYELSLFNSVFGGAMSSRLFQKIREERGAAYTVYSYPNAYTDSGMLSVYAGTNPDAAEEVYGLLLSEAKKLANEGMTRDEFLMAREQLKAGYILGLESTSARMQSLGRRLLLMGNTRTETEVIDRVNAIDFDSTNALMREILSAPHSAALVGKSAEKIAKKISL